MSPTSSLQVKKKKKISESSGLYDRSQSNVRSQNLVRAATCMGHSEKKGGPICGGGPMREVR